ncbi:MAG: hydantoinase B/oxoprolinase family protein [Cyanobium sp.]
MASSQPERPSGGWRFWIDRGGTFTDVIGRRPDGQLHVEKVLSVQPDQPGDPAVMVIRRQLGIHPHAPIPPDLITEVRLGTTVATNALLEHRGAPVLLLINRGLADLLEIGDQHRPELFALRIERPRPLNLRVLEVEGRLAADGTELEPLRCDGPLWEQVHRARAEGFASVAVALLHAGRNPAHELALARWLDAAGVEDIALSHRLSAQPRLVPRGHTALVEAAVGPVLRTYLDGVQQSLGPQTPLRVMRSSGALAAPAELHAKDTILSGPAGGMVGAVAVGAAVCPDTPMVGFDMGGTSTDVFHFDPARGEAGWERSSETTVEGLRLQAPMLPVHTVAAGGGSIIEVRDGRLLVGPRSAGALPGPAAYRRGGPATVTDANLLLGRLPGEALPAVFGPEGDKPVDLVAVRQRFEALAEGCGLTPEAVAEGALRVAIERMAAAVRRISIQRGHDIRDALLVSYGGAGGQHACRLAEALGLRQVLLHPLSGVLSAYGIGQAPQSQLRERLVRQPLEHDVLPWLRRQIASLADEARAELECSGDLRPGDAARQVVRLELRYRGSERGLELPWPQEGGGEQPQGEGSPDPDHGLVETLRHGFAASHQRRFGYLPSDSDLVVERLLLEVAAGGDDGNREDDGRPPAPASVGSPDATATPINRTQHTPHSLSTAATAAAPDAIASDPTTSRCSATATAAAPEAAPWNDSAGGDAPAAKARTRVWLGGSGWCALPLWRRSALPTGARLQGPAVVIDATTTLLLEPHWSALLLSGGELLLQHHPRPATQADADPKPGAETDERTPGGGTQSPVDHGSSTPRQRPRVDPVELELFHHRFAAIAEQMGVQLQLSSRSVNIRERLDFSCALFDRAGQLVANAPHIPVHLGSMGESVASLLADVAAGARAPLEPGDVILSNDPYAGGTHLPDITAITPVFAVGAVPGAPPLFFVASRGHHTDVGGISPGSMPAFSTAIAEEGLLLRNETFLRGGVLEEAHWRDRLAAGPHPVRNADQLLADLQAQVAANRQGATALEQLIAAEGQEVVQRFMAEVQSNAAEAVRRVIDRLQAGSHAVELDGGAWIRVAVTPDSRSRRVRVDFSGTSPQLATNHNAPLAVTRAVVLYVFRCLVGEEIPLNAGCFEPIDLVVPPGCLLHPQAPAAVVAGNVETSQAAANALFGALGVLAASQGTMNNLSFGDEGAGPASRQYYETICGGTGAGVLADGQGFAGASAVQSHMTNSRLTDPEILEDRYPVRLEAFTRRSGSGGAGQWTGGDGVIRQLRALEPLRVSLLTGSRRVPPFGLAGGEPGACGANWWLHGDGSEERLPACCELSLAAGDGLRIETPGGGGYGAAGTAEGRKAAAPSHAEAEQA